MLFQKITIYRVEEKVIRRRSTRRSSSSDRSCSRSHSYSVSPKRTRCTMNSASSDDSTGSSRTKKIQSRIGKKVVKEKKKKQMALQNKFHVTEDEFVTKKKEDRAARFDRSLSKTINYSIESVILVFLMHILYYPLKLFEVFLLWFFFQPPADGEEDINYHITGTSQDLIKHYLRLTSVK